MKLLFPSSLIDFPLRAFCIRNIAIYCIHFIYGWNWCVKYKESCSLHWNSSKLFSVHTAQCIHIRIVRFNWIEALTNNCKCSLSVSCTRIDFDRLAIWPLTAYESYVFFVLLSKLSEFSEIASTIGCKHYR